MADDPNPNPIQRIQELVLRFFFPQAHVTFNAATSSFSADLRQADRDVLDDNDFKSAWTALQTLTQVMGRNTYQLDAVGPPDSLNIKPVLDWSKVVAEGAEIRRPGEPAKGPGPRASELAERCVKLAEALRQAREEARRAEEARAQIEAEVKSETLEALLEPGDLDRNTLLVWARDQGRLALAREQAAKAGERLASVKKQFDAATQALIDQAKHALWLLS